MNVTILGLDYFNATVKDRPGAAYELLSQLAAEQVNLLAFSCVPIGPEYTQLVLFPENTDSLRRAAAGRELELRGPHRAFLIQGDDQLGAFAAIHERLSNASVNVFASNGVTDGRGGYGYIVYVRPEDYDTAAGLLGV